MSDRYFQLSRAVGQSLMSIPVIVYGMKECSSSLVVLRWWHSLWMCVVLVQLSAGRSTRSAGVITEFPCTILYIVHQNQALLLPTLHKSVQPKVLKDGINAGPRGSVALNPPCCSTLYSFEYSLVLSQVNIPDSCRLTCD